MPLAQMVDRAQPVLALLVRTVFGLLLGTVFAVVGLGIAWGSFVFFGAVSHTTLLVLLISGAGIGAALGSFFPWLRLDRGPSLIGSAATILVLLLAAIGGAWGGYQFGANQEVECCVGPAITPITYLAIGATVGANLIGLVLGVARNSGVSRWWRQLKLGTAAR